MIYFLHGRLNQILRALPFIVLAYHLKSNELVQRLFLSTMIEDDEAHLPSLFLNSCYIIQSSQSQEQSDADSSDEDTRESTSKLCLIHKIEDIDVCQTVIEFGR